MTPLPTQLVTVENRSSVVSPTDFYNASWALAYQLKYQYGRSPWVTLGLAPPARVAMLQPNAAPPPGAYNMILLDTSDQQGALGYHEDREGGKVAFAEVFAKTAMQDGVPFSEVLTHEGIETLCDPWILKPRVVKRSQWLYLVEVCDAVQGSSYDVGAPENRRVGVTVANFCLPRWYGLDPTPGPVGGGVDYRGALAKAFQVGKEGYVSRAPADQPEAWESVFGEDVRALPKWASRLPVVHEHAKGVETMEPPVG